MKQTSILILIVLFLTSCYKNKMDEPMVVDITAINPITNEPFKGVKFTITEVKRNKQLIGPAQYDREIIYTGETDANGHVRYEFEVPKKYKWTYEINFHFSQMDVPEGDYHLNKGGSFDYLQRNYDNVFELELMPYGEFYIMYRNTGCQSNDVMRNRSKNLYTGSGQWSDWTTVTGCYEYTSNLLNKPQDAIIYEMEITKNNITTTVIDTFYNNPNQIDTMKYFY